MKKGSALRASATLLATAAATVPLGALALDAWVGRDFAVSALLGACLAAGLAVSSLALAAWSHDKPQAVFLSALAGGFLGRMMAFAAGMALLVTTTRLPVTAFVAGLFSYYVLFQVLEVRALQKLFGRRSALPH
ncbi:MAG: hypothetical protein L0Z52_12620 [Acidobacteria bacterium]|nr:hypothetical protein [Acidobacteriota bacterium]